MRSFFKHSCGGFLRVVKFFVDSGMYGSGCLAGLRLGCRASGFRALAFRV